MARQPDFVYNDSKEFIEALDNCISWLEKDTIIYQRIPREITIAQAILESDYGNSRFATEGNNLFGIRTWDLNKPHLKPFGDPDSIFGVKVFKNKCDSVKDYFRILNTGSAFEEFRQLRFKMIKNDKINVYDLVETLNRFATDPNYVKLVKQTIKRLENERISTTN
tara:strand:- start:425 stop:922 length:498 start_codon:yes stop_codon:yes gene_type:complete